jgi:hypothetical protein
MIPEFGSNDVLTPENWARYDDREQVTNHHQLSAALLVFSSFS